MRAQTRAVGLRLRTENHESLRGAGVSNRLGAEKVLEAGGEHRLKTLPLLTDH
jgi:hypothetical protein